MLTAVSDVELFRDNVDAGEDENDDDADYDEDADGDDYFEEDEYGSDDSDSSETTLNAKFSAGRNVSCTSHIRQYSGHCNCETTKDVNFYGLQDEYIVSGSDGGHFFIWDKKTGRLVNILKGDCEVVNVVQRKSFHKMLYCAHDPPAHPYEPMLAVSGIDSTIKIFSADARSRRDAARAQNGVSAADVTAFSSIGVGQDDVNDTESSDDESENPGGSNENFTPNDDSESDTSEYENECVANNGLRSRKRIGREYKITSKNDMIRRSEIQSQNIRSQGVYQILAAQLALQMRGRETDGVDEENPDCMIM